MTRPWTLAANERFEVYSQQGPESARATLAWLERLRALLIRETGVQPDRLRPARLIGFATAAEYRPYRITTTAEAYYVGTEGRDYIVMALDSPRAAGIAAHEYTHMALRATGLPMPRWLAEGLAEVSSTVRVEDDAMLLGADRPEHSQLLHRAPWIPLSALLRASEPGPQPGLFYAESWALADMVSRAPEYGRLRALIGALASMSPEEAFASVYGTTLDRVAADLRAWIDRRAARPLRLPGVAAESGGATVSEVPRLRAEILLAGLLLDSGEWSRAEAAYTALLPEARENGDLQAGLGTAALQRGAREQAQERWTRALALGVTDDALCFRYAALAQNAGLGESDVRPVLERAVAIRPAFDDARYSLALIEKNAGRFEQALAHLRAMREPPPPRAFQYWVAVSDALNALDRHDEAEAAARKAAGQATTPDEQARAAELAWLARTEIAMQVAPDPQGRPRMVAMRIPRRAADWNPFVEPLDEIRSIEGALREIDCSGPATRIVVEAQTERRTLVIPDPSRVQMRNAPAEFTCGPQSGASVLVVYAAPRAASGDAIVRGIEFRVPQPLQLRWN
jgi:tetratricopeptide (TPR) repeat protein